jgi:hypothetical protein
MREDLHEIERIERYLEGEMDDAERTEFENEMEQNPQLKKDTEFFKNLQAGISRQALKLDIKKAQYRYVKKARKSARIRKFLFGGGSFLIMVVAVVLIVLPEEQREESIIGKILGSNDQPKEVIKAHPEDPFKDYLPESEFFTIDNSADTTITSADGVKLYLPKGSLKLPDGTTPSGPITIEIADADNASESMLGNLVSDDDLLVEDAVFVNAKAGEQQLVPDKETPPYLEIPTMVTSPDKKVYSGTKAKDGSIKWDKPKLPENYLVPYKYKFLDYYPDSFKAIVNSNLPYKGREVANRKLLDSLFFSFGTSGQNVYFLNDGHTSNPINPSFKVEILDNKINVTQHNLGWGFIDLSKTEIGPTNDISLVLINGDTVESKNIQFKDKLFSDNRGNSYVSFNINFSSSDIDNAKQILMETQFCNDEKCLPPSNHKIDLENTCGINPISIKAFVNEKYERSLLATREFMDRLNIIYKTCDKELLNIYINNTDKQLWEIDEMAYEYLYEKENGKSADSGPGGEVFHVEKAGFSAFFSDGKLLAQASEEAPAEDSDSSAASEYAVEDASYSLYFKAFAKLKQTNVPNSHIYAAMIAKEYEKDVAALAKEQKRIEKEYKKEIKEDAKARKAHTKRVEKYEMLVTKRVKSRMKAYGFKVETMGWKAIAEIKTAPAIVPEPLYVNINNYEQYDHYHTYFAVTDLGVIGKLNRNGDGQFIMNEHRIINLPRYNSEKIKLVGIGFKGKDIYYNSMDYSTEESGTVEMTLNKTPTFELKKILGRFSGRSWKHSIWHDMKQQKAFYAEMVRRRKLAQERNFRIKLHNIVYPCCAISTVRPNEGYNSAEFDAIIERPDNTMWEYREGIKVIHPDGKVEYIFKDKDPERFKKYYKMGGGKAEVILPD